MAFRNRINTLMSVYRINNVTLARGIGVDPSVISRWRTGDREPSNPGRTFREIAAFLSGVQLLPIDLKQLENITGLQCQSPDETENAVFSWLSSKNDIIRTEPGSSFDGSLTDVLTDFFNHEAPTPSKPLNLWPYVQKGVPSEHEVFFGSTGKRQAVINFMRSVQSTSKPCDIYLCGCTTPGGPADESFSQLWTCWLQMISRNGHRLHLMVPSVTSPFDLAALLRSPVGSLVNCTFYSAPPEEPVTMMAGNDVGAVVSSPLQRDITLFFKSSNDATFFSGMISRIFKAAPLLLKTCHDRDEYLRHILALEQGYGDLYTYRGALSVLYIPENDLRSLLSKLLPSKEVDSRMEIISMRKKVQAVSLRSYSWTEFISSSTLDAIAVNGTCRISASGLSLEKDITLSGGALKATLENILDMLKFKRRFNLAVNDDPPLQLTMLFREGTGAVFAGERDPGPFRSVRMGPAPMLGSLRDWFSRNTLDKQAAAERIEDAIKGI